MKGSKLNCLLLFALWQSIFLAKQSNAQFHWGKNNRMEAAELTKLLEAYATSGAKRLSGGNLDNSILENEGSGALDPIKDFLAANNFKVGSTKRDSFGNAMEKLRNFVILRRMIPHLENKNLLPRLF